MKLDALLVVLSLRIYGGGRGDILLLIRLLPIVLMLLLPGLFESRKPDDGLPTELEETMKELACD